MHAGEDSAYTQVHLGANTVDELSTAAVGRLDQVDDSLQLGVGAVQAVGCVESIKYIVNSDGFATYL